MAEHRDDPDLHWLDPEQRGIFPLDRFHVPRRLRSLLNNPAINVTVNKAFDQIIAACAEPMFGRDATWINKTVVDLYSQLYAIGHAHSIEVWREDQLIGGLYGVSLGSAFFGESMVSLKSGGSKLALVHTVARLRQGGFTLFDTQFYTPHLGQFGCVEVPRTAYKRLLAKAVDQPHRPLPDQLAPEALASVVQPTTQTS